MLINNEHCNKPIMTWKHNWCIPLNIRSLHLSLPGVVWSAEYADCWKLVGLRLELGLGFTLWNIKQRHALIIISFYDFLTNIRCFYYVNAKNMIIRRSFITSHRFYFINLKWFDCNICSILLDEHEIVPLPLPSLWYRSDNVWRA